VVTGASHRNLLQSVRNNCLVVTSITFFCNTITYFPVSATKLPQPTYSGDSLKGMKGILRLSSQFAISCTKYIFRLPIKLNILINVSQKL
jgi:hypothetical protein